MLYQDIKEKKIHLERQVRTARAESNPLEGQRKALEETISELDGKMRRLVRSHWLIQLFYIKSKRSSQLWIIWQMFDHREAWFDVMQASFRTAALTLYRNLVKCDFWCGLLFLVSWSVVRKLKYTLLETSGEEVVFWPEANLPIHWLKH